MVFALIYSPTQLIFAIGSWSKSWVIFANILYYSGLTHSDVIDMFWRNWHILTEREVTKIQQNKRYFSRFEHVLSMVSMFTCLKQKLLMSISWCILTSRRVSYLSGELHFSSFSKIVSVKGGTILDFLLHGWIWWAYIFVLSGKCLRIHIPVFPSQLAVQSLPQIGW